MIVPPPRAGVLPPMPPDFSNIIASELLLTLGNSSEGVYTYSLGQVVSFNESISSADVTVELVKQNATWIEYNRTNNALSFDLNPFESSTSNVTERIMMRLSDPNQVIREYEITAKFITVKEQPDERPEPIELPQETPAPVQQESSEESEPLLIKIGYVGRDGLVILTFNQQISMPQHIR